VARNESFDIAGPAGRLEAVLMYPDVEPVAAAVVCHAHPLQGGIMHFKVVFRAAKALQRQGLAALRFNFRGVGTSGGTHDQGRGEQEDVKAALDEMERRFPGLPLVLGGFSFGSVMALRVSATDPRPGVVFALGFPTGMLTDTLFVERVRAPRLFVQGAHDAIGPPDQLGALVERLPEPRKLVIIEGADHFFAGKLEELEDTLASWAATRPWAPSA
jgi:alpha/beta superfamily hydrolase